MQSPTMIWSSRSLAPLLSPTPMTPLGLRNDCFRPRFRRGRRHAEGLTVKAALTRESWLARRAMPQPAWDAALGAPDDAVALFSPGCPQGGVQPRRPAFDRGSGLRGARRGKGRKP